MQEPQRSSRLLSLLGVHSNKIVTVDPLVKVDPENDVGGTTWRIGVGRNETERKDEGVTGHRTFSNSYSRDNNIV